MINDELRKVIMQAKTLSDISKELRRAKMRYLQERLLEKVLDGTTSINEMVRVLSTSKTRLSFVPAPAMFNAGSKVLAFT